MSGRAAGPSRSQRLQPTPGGRGQLSPVACRGELRRHLHGAIEVDVRPNETEDLKAQDDTDDRLHPAPEGAYGDSDKVSDEPDDAYQRPGPPRGGPVPFVLPILEFPDEEGVVSEPLGNKQGDERQHCGRPPAGGAIEKAVADRDREGGHPQEEHDDDGGRHACGGDLPWHGGHRAFPRFRRRAGGGRTGGRGGGGGGGGGGFTLHPLWR